MTEKTVNIGCNGYPLATLLGVLFIALKLMEQITWPWIWVLAPFWIGLAFILTIVVIPLVLVSIATILVVIFDRRA